MMLVWRLLVTLTIWLQLVDAGLAASLCTRLAAEPDLDRTLVEKFCHQAPPVNLEIVGKNLKQVEYKAVYDRFLEPAVVSRGRDFLEQHQGWLGENEARYGVGSEVVTAIFLVESDLGRYPGRYRLLEVFTSLASCEEDECLRAVYKQLKPRFPELDYQWLERRARKKAAWAYEQLVALLRLHDRLEIDEVKGSWAGAFGICQFIPASCLDHAADGDGDGRIDLYNFQDAAASVARYLSRHGWRPELDDEARLKVIWSYNHSKLYCSTVLDLSKRIRGEDER